MFDILNDSIGTNYRTLKLITLEPSIPWTLDPLIPWTLNLKTSGNKFKKFTFFNNNRLKEVLQCLTLVKHLS